MDVCERVFIEHDDEQEFVEHFCCAGPEGHDGPHRCECGVEF
jgi:hypothetical protein